MRRVVNKLTLGALLGGAFLFLACADTLAPRALFAGMMSGSSHSLSVNYATPIRDTAWAARAQIDTAIADPDMVQPLVRASVRADSQLGTVIASASDTLDAKKVKAHADSAATVLRDSVVNRPQWKNLTKYAQRAIAEAIRQAGVVDSLASAAMQASPPDTVVVVTPPPDTTPVPPPPQPACTTVAPDPSTGIAELPRVYLATCYPAVARRVPVPAGWNLQDALNAAVAGDEIVLAAGASYVGNFQWTRCLAGVVVVTGATGPAEGVRVTPAIASASQYPKLVSPNNAPALLAKNGGCKLRLSRLEITATAASATNNFNNGLVRLGDGETTLDAQPSDITLDRVYLHGTATTFTQNGVIVNGRALALVDSWVDQIRWKGVESHCVVGYQGAGPIKLVNNHFDCASIGVLFGGAARSIADVAPADIEVRGNHFTKDSAYVGYVAKNLFELKDAKRVLLEGNVIEHAWYEAQSAMAINLQSLTDENNPAVQTTDVTVRWNDVRTAGQCIVASARGYNGVASPMARVEIDDNACTNIGVDSINRVLLLTADLQGIALRRNTFLRNALPRKNSVTYIQRGLGPQASSVEFTGNLIGPGMDYPCVFGEGKSGSAALTNYAVTWTFTGNTCVDSHPGASAFPTGNTFVDSLPATGGVDRAELARRTAGVVVP